MGLQYIAYILRRVEKKKKKKKKNGQNINKVLILAALWCLKMSQDSIIKGSLFGKFKGNGVLKYSIFIRRAINI